jgi:hypothetical protein
MLMVMFMAMLMVMLMIMCIILPFLRFAAAAMAVALLFA